MIRSTSAAVALALAVFAPIGAAPQGPAGVVDTVLNFSATDGTRLEAKLSVPAGAAGPVGVVFNLHGAGPRNFDHRVRYRDKAGEIKAVNYYDYYARELAARGFAFFRMSKRGCSVDAAGAPQVDRAVFSKVTSTVLLDDYARALDVLRARKEVNARDIILLGGSEGTRLAPQLATRSPAGITRLALMSYQADNIHDTVVWQNTVGPWRAITHLIPAAADDRLTRAEYDEALKTDATLAQRLPFAAFDTDRDAAITRDEAIRVVKPRLDAILKAVEDRNDDFLWAALVNLSSAYLLDGWKAEPTSALLLKVKVPIAIFHGEADGTTRVEGAREAAEAFTSAGRRDLTLFIYPGFDHDLGWTPQGALGPGPKPFQDFFAWVAGRSR
jgi:alpha-beta hydrolase superfamily lysophospholipase